MGSPLGRAPACVAWGMEQASAQGQRARCVSALPAAPRQCPRPQATRAHSVFAFVQCDSTEATKAWEPRATATPGLPGNALNTPGLLHR